jgi:Protein of unknown function (DUF4230)
MADHRHPGASRAMLLAAALLGGILLAFGVGAYRLAHMARGLVERPGRTSVTQAVVVERMRAVARLVTSETTLRDVVVYENRRLGSTKRALVVVTGKVLAGIDLDAGAGVHVDAAARRVRVTLPRARVLSVEVTDLKTYDEHSGLWNPFRPADRDTIYRLAREQLVTTAGELAVTEHAEQSARRLLEMLLGADGYATEVAFVRRAAPPAVPEGGSAARE